VQSARYRPLTVFELQGLMAALAATGLLLGTISEEREATARRLRLSLRLAAASEMAAALAHELNQPLAALTSYARAMQLLVQRLDAGTRAAAPLLDDVSGKLVAEAARAGDVVKRLRGFFRDQTTQRTAVDLQALITQTVASHEDPARDLSVRLQCRVEAPLPVLQIDAVQVSVVLRNLVVNALEAAAAPSGEAAAVNVRAWQQGESVVVEVLDTGVGLARDEVRSVFEGWRSDKPGGMGVGLSISQAIVEAHGGRLWAEPGPGGRFFFSLPVPPGSS
jgi:signal transduction histidine kinase